MVHPDSGLVKETEDLSEFMSNLKLDLDHDEVFVLPER